MVSKFVTRLEWPSWFSKKQRTPCVSVVKTPPRFDSPDYWGSTEEHEIQEVLQRIISSSLDSAECKEALIQLHTYLEMESDGWVDRFSACQGVIVLKKLLSDINSSDEYMKLDGLAEYRPEIMERELAIIKCFKAAFSRSNVARELATGDKRQSLLHTLLRSALSPNQETRSIASEALQHLKSVDYPSNMLQVLTICRCSSRKKARLRCDGTSSSGEEENSSDKLGENSPVSSRPTSHDLKQNI